MTIRKAEELDAPGMAAVSINTWRFAYQQILPANVLANLSYEKRLMKIQVAIQCGEPYWVADVNHRIVGFSLAGPNRHKFVPADAELYSIYVEPAFHGTGTGKKLLAAVIPELLEEGFQSLCVFAFRDNPLARRFYTSTGAVPHDESVFNVAGVDYPDQSYVWSSLAELANRLDVKPPSS